MGATAVSRSPRGSRGEPAPPAKRGQQTWTDFILTTEQKPEHLWGADDKQKWIRCGDIALIHAFSFRKQKERRSDSLLVNSRGRSKTCTWAAWWWWWPRGHSCRGRGWWRAAGARSTVDSNSRSPPRRRTRSDPWRSGLRTCCCFQTQWELRGGKESK